MFLLFNRRAYAAQGESEGGCDPIRCWKKFKFEDAYWAMWSNIFVLFYL